ncbi:MAG: hypothetical protein WCC60_00590 [Ilumatobacteraceae bacterium]
MAAAQPSTRGIARWGSWRIPVLAWLVSRALGFVALVVTPTPDGRWFNQFGLTAMDGGWYRIILTDGYPNWSSVKVGTAWPFFPLYPWLADQPTRLGAPIGPSMIVVSWAFALVALGGMWRLAAGRYDERVAALSVWLLALLPGSIGLVLAYSDSLFVAALVWTLVLVDELGRKAASGAMIPRWAWWRVGALVAVATASRPNGFMLVLVVWIAIWCVHRSWRHMVAVALPSAVFLAAWMVYCQRKVGDPLIFLTAKDAWDESSLWKVFAHPFAREAVPFHLAVGVIVVALAAPSVRRLPLWWTWCIGLLVVPQLLLGVEGLARYVTLAAPLSVAGALTLSRRPAWVQWATVGAAACGLMFLGVWVVRYSWVP